MGDREIMESELLTIKGVCDLYLHATLESTTAEVHNTFKNALNEAVNIQNKIYNLMSERGWYQNTPVEQPEINTAKEKFSNAN